MNERVAGLACGIAAAAAVVTVASLARAQAPSVDLPTDSVDAEGAPDASDVGDPPRCEAQALGCFEDHDGVWRDEHVAHTRMVGEPDPDYLRTFVENLGLVAIGTIWYYIEFEENRADWDYDSWTQRFDKDAFRYDNNDFPMNFVFHPMSGALYYGLSRTNELSVFASAVSSFLSSWTWEFLLEFREKISLNDTLVTPAAGVVYGEFFHRLGQYLNGAPGGGSKGQRGLRWSAGLPLAFHRWLDDERIPADARSNERGWAADMHADFRLGYGPTLAKPNEGSDFVQHELQFEGEIVALPGYLRPGRFSRVFKSANITSLEMRARLAAEGTGVELAGDTVLVGMHDQSITETANGLRGAAVTLGTSMAYLYRRDEFDDFTDELGLMGLPGLALDTHFFMGPASLHLRGRAHGEFAGVHSGAFAAWQEANPDARAKSILRKQGYYYGWGGSAGLQAELRLPYVQLGGGVRWGGWNSREGLDRAQRLVTHDVRARDRALDWEAWARVVPFPEQGLFVEGAWMGQRRRSHLESLSTTQELERWQVSVGVVR